jgi:hypothetical protein
VEFINPPPIDSIYIATKSCSGVQSNHQKEKPVKTLFTIAMLLSFAAQANTVTRCVRNADGSVTCTTYQSGGKF